jgi:DNA-binding NtrC family response regulator
MSTNRSLASETKHPRILVVDDETMICELLSSVLEDDYDVICATTSNEALQVLAEQSIDVMLLDYHLRLGGAVKVAARADEIGTPMVWMTGDYAVEIKSHSVLLKPFHIDRVSEVLTKVRRLARLPIKPVGQAATAAPWA